MSTPAPYFRSGPVSVHLGDVLEVLAGFPNRHFTAVVTRLTGPRTAKVENDHPTVKPADLMRWLVELARRPGGGERLLDPFCGSGSTLIAAARAGFEAVGIEKHEPFARLAARRFVADAPLFHRDETPTRTPREDQDEEETRPRT